MRGKHACIWIRTCNPLTSVFFVTASTSLPDQASSWYPLGQALSSSLYPKGPPCRGCGKKSRPRSRHTQGLCYKKEQVCVQLVLQSHTSRADWHLNHYDKVLTFQCQICTLGRNAIAAYLVSLHLVTPFDLLHLQDTNTLLLARSKPIFRNLFKNLGMDRVMLPNLVTDAKSFTAHRREIKKITILKNKKYDLNNLFQCNVKTKWCQQLEDKSVEKNIETQDKVSIILGCCIAQNWRYRFSPLCSLFDVQRSRRFSVVGKLLSQCCRTIQWTLQKIKNVITDDRTQLVSLTLQLNQSILITTLWLWEHLCLVLLRLGLP